MAWQSLSSCEPTYQWRSYETPLLGSQLLRVVSTYSERPYGYVHFRQLYSDGHFGLRRIYPDSATPFIFDADIPSELTDVGVVSWYAQIKLVRWAYSVGNFDWTLQLQQWVT